MPGTSPVSWEKHLAILQEISDAIVVSDNIHTVAHLMLDLAIRHTDSEKGSLMLLDDRNELYILAARGMDERFQRHYRVRLGEGIAGTVASEGRPVLVEDIDRDPRFGNAGRDRYKTRSFISCPLKGSGRIFGVLNINDKKSGSPFSREEFALLRIIANQAAVAIRNNDLINRLKVQSAEVEEINRKLTDSDVSKTEFLTRIAHELRTPLNSIKGAVYYLAQTPTASAEERKDFLDIIGSEVRKLIDFSEQQLDFLRFEDEGRVREKKILLLDRVLKETLDSRLLQKVLADRRLQLRVDLPGGMPEIVGDRILVGQFFIHVIEGICLHLEAGAILTLGAAEEDHIVVRLEASAPLPERILRCFSHVPSRPAEWFGDCVKIYLALKNAESHGWEITAGNGPEGFRLRLLIPRNVRQRVEAAVNATIDMLVEFTSDLLNVNTCSLMLMDEVTGDLAIRAARGVDEDIVRRTRIKVGDRIAGWVAQEGKPLLVEDIETDARFGRPNLSRQYASRSLMSLPLRVGEKVVGVVNLNNRRGGGAFTPLDLRIARVFCERITLFLGQLKDEGRAEKDLFTLIGALNDLLAAEKAYHKKTIRQAELTDLILEKLGADDAERDLGVYVAMIYDLGLMPMEQSVLKKKGRLTSTERNSLKAHPHATIDLLGEVEFCADARNIILHHHERYDGSGYPQGLRGEEIPRLSRVLSAVDAFCAMTEERPYRKRMSPEEALAELQSDSGRAYDPRVVAALVEALTQGH